MTFTFILSNPSHADLHLPCKGESVQGTESNWLWLMKSPLALLMPDHHNQPMGNQLAKRFSILTPIWNIV